MSRYFDGSGDHLTVASAVVSATPLTMAVWCRRTATGSTHALMSACSPTSGNNQFRLRVSSGDLLVADAITTSASGSGGISIPNTTSWHHCVGVWRSDTDRQAYVNGTGDTVGTTSRAVGSISSLRIGAASEGWYVLTGYLAHPACWNVALTDAEIAALAAGASPLSIRPGALVAYYPHLGRDSPEIDIVGRYDLTVTNAAANSEEPLALRLPRRRIFLPAATGSGALAAAGALSITGSADLDATGALAAAGALSITGSADLDATGALAAAGALSISGSADLGSGSSNDLVAAGALSITGSADLDATGRLTAAGALSITGSADLDGPTADDIASTGTLSITGSAALSALGALIAAGTIRITGSAALTQTVSVTVPGRIRVELASARTEFGLRGSSTQIVLN